MNKNKKQTIQKHRRYFPSHIIFQGNCAIHAAANLEDPAIINVLLAVGADPNVPNEDRKLPLHLAAIAGQCLLTKMC